MPDVSDSCYASSFYASNMALIGHARCAEDMPDVDNTCKKTREQLEWWTDRLYVGLCQTESTKTVRHSPTCRTESQKTSRHSPASVRPAQSTSVWHQL